MKLRINHNVRNETLRSIWLFAGCDHRQLALITRITTPTSVPENRALTVQGTTGEECFIIIEGEAVAVRDTIVLGRLRPGRIFGEMALVDGGPRVATVWSAMPMELLVMNRREFSTLLNAGIPSVSRRMMQLVEERLRGADERLVGPRDPFVP